MLSQLLNRFRRSQTPPTPASQPIITPAPVAAPPPVVLPEPESEPLAVSEPEPVVVPEPEPVTPPVAVSEPEPVVVPEPEPVAPPPKRCLRPTFHQLHLLHWPTCDKPLTWVERLLTDLKAQIQESNRHVWDVEWNQKKKRSLERHIRYPLIRSQGFYPLAETPSIKVALFVYQDGTDLLLHIIWYWDGEDSEDSEDSEVEETVFKDEFEQILWSKIPNDTKGYLGEARLLTIVTEQYPPHERATLASDLAKAFIHQESQLEPLALRLPGGATLYTQPSRLFDQERRGAILLYHHSDAEAVAEADHLVTVTWPLLALYQQTIEQRYLKDYLKHLEPQLANTNQTLTQTLTHHSHAKTWGNLKRAQHFLTTLSAPQSTHLDTLNRAEHLHHQLTITLDNLNTRLQRAPLLQNHHQQSLLTHQAHQYHAQLASDIQNAHLIATRTTRTIELLHTHADVMQARYERSLNFVIAITGTALAVGQLVDKEGATYLYTLLHFDKLLPYIPYLNYPTPDTDGFAFAFRMLLTVLVALIVWIVMSLWLRVRK